MINILANDQLKDPNPAPIEPGVLMLVPHHLNPNPLSRVLVTIGSYKNHPFFQVFSGNFPETTAKNTSFSEKMGMCMRPPHAFEWGMGAGWRITKLTLPLPSLPESSVHSRFMQAWQGIIVQKGSMILHLRAPCLEVWRNDVLLFFVGISSKNLFHDHPDLVLLCPT